MITNERQYEQTNAAAARFRDGIAKAEASPPDKKRDVQIAGMRAQLSALEAELRGYEQLKASGGGDFTMPLGELGQMLILARIARGWRQKDLAEKLEVAVGTIERYEKNDYMTASLMTLFDAARVLGLTVTCHGAMVKLPVFPELPAPKKVAAEPTKKRRNLK